MLGLLVMVLFGATGFTIHHEDWFGALTPRVVQNEGQLPVALIKARDDLKIVEQLRSTFDARGAMSSFADTEDELVVSFREPGQTWEITVEKTTGRASSRHELFNLAAIFNNLHRGRFTGPAWGWVIDLSAFVILLACATGFVLWLALPKKRMLGIAFLAAGTVATMGVIYFFVPGPDAKPHAPRAPAAQR
jgi:hypothetical protein